MLGRVAVVPKGEYVQGAAYTRLDVVTMGGQSYICAQDTQAAPPGEGWQLLAAKGEALTYAMLTEEQLAELQKPATDAAAEIRRTDVGYKAQIQQQASDFEVSQQTRAKAFESEQAVRGRLYAQAEAARDAAFSEQESGRQQAERLRAEAETLRKQQESARVDEEGKRVEAEKLRVKAEAKRENDFLESKQAADDAAGKADESAQKADDAAKRADDAADKALQAAYHFPVWDAEAGEFTNESIKAWLAWNADGKVYGVDQTLDETQTCAKVLANAGIENPVPSTFAKVGSDPYFGKGPFRWYHANGYVDDDGTKHVTGIKEFGHFSYTDGRDVLQLTPVRYVSYGFVDGKYRTVNSDTPQAGLHPEEGSTLPNGSVQPYMLRAAFPAGLVEDKPVSRPGIALWNRTCSHNSMNEKAKLKGGAYSGLTAADLDYLYEMNLLKYANKSSQNTFAGCTNHAEQVLVTAASEGSASVVIDKATADKWPIGSAIMVGTTTVANRDRGSSDAYDLADHANILRKEVVGESNVRLVLDCPPFDSAIGQLVSTSPWNPGATLGIVYDGSPTSNTSGREPFVLQGIECMVGVYEWLGDVLLKNAGDGWKAYLCTDTQKSSTDVTADYAEIYRYADKDADGWSYPMAMVKSGGVYMPWNWGASTTTGTGDGTWYHGKTTTGTRGFQAFGNLWYGSFAGLRCANLCNWPVWTGWNFGSRLSLNGRNGVNPGQRPTGA